MNSEDRKARFEQAQTNTYRSAAEFEDARTEADRERHYRRVKVWALVTEALRTTPGDVSTY